MTGYTDTILKYAADDTYTGSIDNPDGMGEVGLNAEEAGKRLAVRFTLAVSNEIVDTLRFQVFGCGFTIAACAAAAELAEGRPLNEALAIDPAAVNAALEGLPDERSYCADLAIEALHAAVKSARNGTSVQAAVHNVTREEEHCPRVNAENPVYSALIASPLPEGMAEEDRHLFACLIAVAAQDPHERHEALGLSKDDFQSLLATCFPGIGMAFLEARSAPATEPAPEINDEVLEILLSHVPDDARNPPDSSALWLARILAARAAHPGHLWTAMGLFARPELTASIRRILPSLAEANNQGMRWKRYLFKQVCDLHDAMLCKSPNCGVCSDYALCFAPEDE